VSTDDVLAGDKVFVETLKSLVEPAIGNSVINPTLSTSAAFISSILEWRTDASYSNFNKLIFEPVKIGSALYKDIQFGTVNSSKFDGVRFNGVSLTACQNADQNCAVEFLNTSWNDSKLFGNYAGSTFNFSSDCPEVSGSSGFSEFKGNFSNSKFESVCNVSLIDSKIAGATFSSDAATDVSKRLLIAGDARFAKFNGNGFSNALKKADFRFSIFSQKPEDGVRGNFGELVRPIIFVKEGELIKIWEHTGSVWDEMSIFEKATADDFATNLKDAGLCSSFNEIVESYKALGTEKIQELRALSEKKCKE